MPRVDGFQLHCTELVPNSDLHPGITFPLAKNVTLPATEIVAVIGDEVLYVALLPPPFNAIERFDARATTFVSEYASPVGLDTQFQRALV
jgi:hypothetical protein